jgi:hypothetical protein
LTLIEKVLNNIMRDDLPNTPEKLNRLRNSQVGSENRVIADIIEQHGDWGRVQVDQRQKELEARLSEFFHRDLPTHLIINL